MHFTGYRNNTHKYMTHRQRWLVYIYSSMSSVWHVPAYFFWSHDWGLVLRVSRVAQLFQKIALISHFAFIRVRWRQNDMIQSAQTREFCSVHFVSCLKIAKDFKILTSALGMQQFSLLYWTVRYDLSVQYTNKFYNNWWKIVDVPLIVFSDVSPYAARTHSHS